MRIEHIAIWVKDLENMRAFYERYFHGTAGAMYINPKKQFRSYFITFETGCRLELMHKTDIPENQTEQPFTGITHFAFSTGNRESVDRLTDMLKADGYLIASEPRVTGDGYYESVIKDPEGNLVEITE